jgi:rhodanese-related sulfurtransferase
VRSRLALRPAFFAAAQLFALAAVLAWLATFIPSSWRPSRAPAPVASAYALTPEKLRASPWFDAILWLDLRRPKDYAAGHIPGALPFDEASWDEHLGQLLDRWSPDTPVVVYCDSPACGASERVAARLRQELGVDNIHVLAGGWAAWTGQTPPASDDSVSTAP